MKISNKAYDILKWVAQYVLPGLGTLYFTLSSIWGLPYGEQIIGTISAIDAFLGLLIGLSSSTYEGDGDLVIDQSNPKKDIYRLDLSIPVSDIPSKDKVILSVKPNATIEV